MNAFAAIAKGMSPQEREILETFRTAEEPLPAGFWDLPMGFLELVCRVEGFKPLWKLSDFGRKVAEAAARGALTHLPNAYTMPFGYQAVAIQPEIGAPHELRVFLSGRWVGGGVDERGCAAAARHHYQHNR